VGYPAQSARRLPAGRLAESGPQGLGRSGGMGRARGAPLRLRPSRKIGHSPYRKLYGSISTVSLKSAGGLGIVASHARR
jgi:hypothetical protein